MGSVICPPDYAVFSSALLYKIYQKQINFIDKINLNVILKRIQNMHNKFSFSWEDLHNLLQTIVVAVCCVTDLEDYHVGFFYRILKMHILSLLGLNFTKLIISSIQVASKINLIPYWKPIFLAKLILHQKHFKVQFIMLILTWKVYYHTKNEVVFKCISENLLNEAFSLAFKILKKENPIFECTW